MAHARWDGDERGEGVADARTFMPGVAALLEAAQRHNWVAERPDLHLLPHLERACKSLPLELVDARTSPDGSFDVELRWTGERQRLGDAKAAVFALVGSFAELSTFVTQHGSGSAREDVVFEIVTGFVEGETDFAPHGHTVRLSVVGIG